MASIPTLVVNILESGDTVVLYLTNAAAELPQHWQIGRAADCAVRVANSRVSNHHATIRAEPRTVGNDYTPDGTRRYIWLIRDNGSTNGTYQGGIKIGGRGEPCFWLEIEEGDSVRVAGTKIRFSFSGHFEDDEDTESGAAQAEEPPTEALPITQGVDDLWDILALVLTGPKTTSNLVWWLFLAALGAVVFVALEWIRSR